MSFSSRRATALVRRAKRAVAAERIAFWRSRPIRPHQVVYESFAGNGMLCNPEAIFRHLIQQPEYAHLDHVWVLSDDAAIERFDDEFASNPRVSYVRRDSSAYENALSVSGWLVNNSTFPSWFGKRPGQVYLNTWHGTPLKLMGFDMPDGAVQSANTVRNFLMSDFLLAANSFMTDTMYERAYRLSNVFAGRIVEEGYPRIDRQRLDTNDENSVRRELEDNGVSLGGKGIVLFTPTWRGRTFDRPEDNIADLESQLAALQVGIGDDHVVVLKVHQVIHAHAAKHPQLVRSLAPNTIPTNVLLGIAAGLVTDYSSIFFDFLATGRPIAFFAPDAESYASVRGTYLPLDTLPGPVRADAEETGRAIAQLLAPNAAQHPQYSRWAERFTPHEDGNATARVVDIVFGGVRDGYRVGPVPQDGRRRLLIYLGGMRPNGITTSALNLLNAIDLEKYDVTALLPKRRAATRSLVQDQIPEGVRQVFRIGGMNGTKVLQLRRRLEEWGVLTRGTRVAAWRESLWNAEWTRIFGGSQFDWLADFSGYGPQWTNLLLHSPSTSSTGGAAHRAIRAVWMHNEMAADRAKVIKGKPRARRQLEAVFAIFPEYDQLVSVSEELTTLNRAEFTDLAPSDRFRTVRNLVNVARVETGVRQPLSETLAPIPAVDDSAPPAEFGSLPPEWFDALSDKTSGNKWFVTVGRLSRQKNHARLIRAFLEVRAQHPEARLLIVGDGELRSDLQRQIDEAGAQDIAFLTGEQRNPYALLAASDCFVLSSLYEGQPMVLLEAAICALPIVSTAFGSVHGALPAGSIRIVDQTDESLAAGMIAYLEGDVPPARFDAQAYQAGAIAEFEALLPE